MGCRVSVNVSSVQLHAPGFASQVATALRDSGLPASRLELELTEGVLIRDAQAAQACIAEIRAFGVGVALDDFGTGYSSLSYLQHFTFDRVKIDRSFVQSLLAKRESEILVRGCATSPLDSGWRSPPRASRPRPKPPCCARWPPTNSRVSCSAAPSAPRPSGRS